MVALDWPSVMFGFGVACVPFAVVCFVSYRQLRAARRQILAYEKADDLVSAMGGKRIL